MPVIPDGQADEPRHNFGGKRRVTLGLVLTAAVGSVICLSAIIASRAVISWDGVESFDEAAGEDVRRLLSDAGIDIASLDIGRITMRRAWTRDSHCEWWRVEVVDADAAVLADQFHTRLVPSSRFLREKFEIERRDSTIVAISVRAESARSPAWFRPPVGEGRRTEVMSWYHDSPSGYGTGCDTLCDVAAGVLWIYVFSAQHERLWARGAGESGEA